MTVQVEEMVLNLLQFDWNHRRTGPARIGGVGPAPIE
jgi:hypothetical protein